MCMSHSPDKTGSKDWRRSPAGRWEGRWEWEPPQLVWARLQPAPSITGVLSPAEPRRVTRQGWLIIATRATGSRLCAHQRTTRCVGCETRNGKTSSKTVYLLLPFLMASKISWRKRREISVRYRRSTRKRVRNLWSWSFGRFWHMLSLPVIPHPLCRREMEMLHRVPVYPHCLVHLLGLEHPKDLYYKRIFLPLSPTPGGAKFGHSNI